MLPVSRKKKRLPSLRGQLVALSVGSSFVALVISVVILLLLISNVLGGYTRREAEFAMKAISDSLSVKTTLVEDMLLGIRRDETLSAALSGGGLEPESPGGSATSAALSGVADLYSDKNIVDAGLPFVEMVYLFDSRGAMNRAVYHEYLTVEQASLDAQYEALYRSFLGSGKDVQIVPSDGYINILYTVYDAWTEPLGTAVFAVSGDAVRFLMNKTADYDGAFWFLFGKDGGVLLQSGGVQLTQAERTLLSSARRSSGYLSKIGGQEYLLYTKFLSMGLRCAMGVPGNQLSRLLYRAVLPYLFLAVALLLTIGIVLFFAVMRLTKPLPEVASRLQEVAGQNFSVKLPEYDCREFATIGSAFNTMTDTINHLINDVYEKKLLAMDSEIRLLQSQINPHFMYNVLCSIALTAQIEGNRDVWKMASDFAALTQARLSHGGDEKVTIGEELRYVQFYLDLQKVRFEDRISWKLELDDPSLRSCLIPKLTLEMVVENAVGHGLEPKEGPGTVTVRLSGQGGDIRIVVSDDGVGFPGPGGEIPLPLPVPEHGGGRHNHIALNSVMRLLQHFYGPGYGLAIVSFPGRGTTVTMTIPREEAAHDEGDDRG